ncbi:MAG TPA: hypothetical protein VFD90_17235 [Gaiellales bacterium]|jgi:hypothetical protein|nr:hypothetical protein [Gaiellales bacterium]
MTTPSAPTARSTHRAAPVEGGPGQAAPDAGPPLDPAVHAVALALRGARARTGMSEQQVVAVLAEQGFSVTVARLRSWERTGLIRVDAASRLADAYGTTIDALAGRRAYRSRPPASPDLPD